MTTGIRQNTFCEDLSKVRLKGWGGLLHQEHSKHLE